MEQAFIRIMFVSLCQQCVFFKDKKLKKQFNKDVISVLNDIDNEEDLRRAKNVWMRRAKDFQGMNASMCLLTLYHFVLLSEIEIDYNSHLQQAFEGLSGHIPQKYFPKTEKQTDSVYWLEAKGSARTLLSRLRKPHEQYT